MGMYTDFLFDAELKKTTPLSIINFLDAWMSQDREIEDKQIPDHPLFKTARWGQIGHGGSYYFDAQPHNLFRYDEIAKSWFLNIRCNLKNYDDEIEKFVDWIKPYLNKSEGEFLGFWRYEECETPTLIFY